MIRMLLWSIRYDTIPPSQLEFCLNVLCGIGSGLVYPVTASSFGEECTYVIWNITYTRAG